MQTLWAHNNFSCVDYLNNDALSDTFDDQPVDEPCNVNNQADSSEGLLQSSLPAYQYTTDFPSNRQASSNAPLPTLATEYLYSNTHTPLDEVADSTTQFRDNLQASTAILNDLSSDDQAYYNIASVILHEGSYEGQVTGYSYNVNEIRNENHSNTRPSPRTVPFTYTTTTLSDAEDTAVHNEVRISIEHEPGNIEPISPRTYATTQDKDTGSANTTGAIRNKQTLPASNSPEVLDNGPIRLNAAGQPMLSRARLFELRQQHRADNFYDVKLAPKDDKRARN